MLSSGRQVHHRMKMASIPQIVHIISQNFVHWWGHCSYGITLSPELLRCRSSLYARAKCQTPASGQPPAQAEISDW